MFNPISNLPWPWEAVYDERYGLYYYWNYWTGESKWKKPELDKRSASIYSPKRPLEDPSNLYEAVAIEISEDMKEDIKKMYPNLSEEIIDNAIEEGKEMYLKRYGGFSRRHSNSKEARDYFLENILESIGRYQQQMLEIVKTIMLSKQRPPTSEQTGFAQNVYNMKGREDVLTGESLAGKQFEG